MSVVAGGDQAIKNIKRVFEETSAERKKSPLNENQIKAIKDLIVPNNEHFCMKFLDAAGETKYPGSKDKKREKVITLLDGYLQNGDAPVAVRDYALEQMAGMMTLAHINKINNAFGWAPSA
jgi:hypothetical protein